ncbi:MAG: UPF0158 family protein [Erysipelotrichaceae bacterium]|nr:UPF0158 family protein [Erysipelotrichaceae bacterium]
MIYIEDIADALDMAMDEFNQFLNVKTGEIVTIAEDSAFRVDEDEELMLEIEESGDYYSLPDQHDLDEWHVMEDFAYSLDNKEYANELLNRLNRRKAYRNFKDAINYYGIAQDYYQFRDKAYIKKAIDWCHYRHIAYSTKTDDMKKFCEEYEKEFMWL